MTDKQILESKGFVFSGNTASKGVQKIEEVKKESKVIKDENGFIYFTIEGNPVGKPRMTQRDKWAKRDVVMRYRDWADKARASAPELPAAPKHLIVKAYLPVSASWSEKKKKAHFGQPHLKKPDIDNVCKSCMDSLFEQDCTIHKLVGEKYYEEKEGTAKCEVWVK